MTTTDSCNTVSIECTKEGVKFACNGDIGSGSVTLRSHTNVEKPEQNIDISLSESVALTFSLKYLVNFCKASGLSSRVRLSLSNEVPLLVEYPMANNSYLRFYLAPKVCILLSLRKQEHVTDMFDRLVTRNKHGRPNRENGRVLTVEAMGLTVQREESFDTIDIDAVYRKLKKQKRRRSKCPLRSIVCV